jgi:L-threonylcarbamoyladenylate synthase
MKIIKHDENTIKIATEILKGGGLVIYATETLYGIGGDATNPDAVQKLTKYKNRPLGKPYSIAVMDINMAKKYVKLNKTASNLYKEYLPGPLTIISKGKHKVAQGIESENGTLGIRIPSYRLVTQMVRALNKPITATSANASYKKRPYKISDILENISSRQKKLIDLVIDAGELPHNDPSTVIDTTLDDSVTLRQGEIKLTNENLVVTRNEEATQNFAKEMWQKYENHKGKRSIIFALQGQMGAGKTQFTKGLAKAMGIIELITSPTFALENEYQTGEKKLYHFDAWRLENSKELNALGFSKLIKDRSVISIEWAEKVADLIREYDDEAIIVWINISFAKKDNERVISWTNL